MQHLGRFPSGPERLLVLLIYKSLQKLAMSDSKTSTGDLKTPLIYRYAIGKVIVSEETVGIH